ncbi:MAG: hypothetical protein IKH64_05815 [Prevotella sp.]|jgi:hypothetical protein|nr:hypothetical protein [Prevotella sp.]
MKRINNLMVMVLLAVLSMTFVSCVEDDEDVAYNLEGTWYGSVKSDYFDRRYGYTTEWTDVQLEFYKDPYVYAEGSGREIDYNGRYYSSVVGFNYIVRNHVIYIEYYDGSKIAIYNYSLWMDEFKGEFHDYYTGEYLASFRFERLDYGWDYGYNKLKEGLTDQVIQLDK